MASAGTVTVDFAAEVAKFNAQLKTVQSSLKGIEGSFRSFQKTADLALGALAASGIIAFAKSVFAATDALGDAAVRAGIAADSFSRLKFAAEQSDVQFSELTIGIKNFQQNLSEAKDGIESAARTFALLGIQAERLSGLNLEQQLGEIADAFKNISDPADRTRIAVELFGRSGQALIPMLIQGKEGIAALTAEADRLGITLSNETVKAIDEADKAVKRLKATLDSITSKALAGLSIMIFGPPDEVQRIDAEIEKLTNRIKALSLLRIPTHEGPIQLFSAQIEDAKKRIEELLERERELLGLQPVPKLPKIPLLQFDFADVKPPSLDLADIGKEEREAAEKAAQLAQDIQIEKLQQTFKFAEEDRQLRQDLHAQVLEDIRSNADAEMAIVIQKENERVKAVLRAEETIAGLKQNAFNLSISLLQTLGQRNKAFAIAALAFQTAMAVKQILISTSVAAAAALEPPPIGAGPIAGIPLAASIKAWGAANAALTAGIGLAQIANVASPRTGGPALGTPSNPVVTQPSGAFTTGTERQVVQIIFNGPVAGEDAFRDLIEDLFDRDVVVIGSNTRQAQTIRGG